eukprot:12415309-Karenia_brevis.AAC.1
MVMVMVMMVMMVMMMVMMMVVVVVVWVWCYTYSHGCRLYFGPPPFPVQLREGCGLGSLRVAASCRELLRIAACPLRVQ